MRVQLTLTSLYLSIPIMYQKNLTVMHTTWCANQLRLVWQAVLTLLPVIPASWYSCPWVISFPWVQATSSGLLQMNAIQEIEGMLFLWLRNKKMMAFVSIALSLACCHAVRSSPEKSRWQGTKGGWQNPSSSHRSVPGTESSPMSLQMGSQPQTTWWSHPCVTLKTQTQAMPRLQTTETERQKMCVAHCKTMGKIVTQQYLTKIVSLQKWCNQTVARFFKCPFGLHIYFISVYIYMHIHIYIYIQCVYKHSIFVNIWRVYIYVHTWCIMCIYLYNILIYASIYTRMVSFKRIIFCD